MKRCMRLSKERIYCSCSVPKLPDELVSTNDEVYIRFHGRAMVSA